MKLIMVRVKRGVGSKTFGSRLNAVFLDYLTN